MAEFLHCPRAWGPHSGTQLDQTVRVRNLHVRPATMQLARSAASTSKSRLTQQPAPGETQMAHGKAY